MGVLLIVITSLLVVLSFAPAIREYWRQDDAAPLDIAEDYGEDVRNISYRLETYMQPLVSTELQTRIPTTRKVSIPLVAEREVSVTHLAEPVRAVDSCAYPDPLYCSEILDGPSGAVYNGIFGEKPISIGSNSVVKGWLHTKKHAIIGSHTTLQGSVRAQETAIIGTGCSFERLEADRIEFYDDAAPKHGAVTLDKDLDFPVCTLPSLWDKLQPWSKDSQRIIKERKLVHGDFTVTSDELIRKNLVVSGTLTIEPGARIHGSVKAGKAVIMKRRSLINGDIFCDGDIAIGEDCHVRGVVFAEKKLDIAPRTVIGTTGDKTTVSAAELYVRAGVRIYGTAWATEKGKVLDYREAA